MPTRGDWVRLAEAAPRVVVGVIGRFWGGETA
jgi:hypothetical protein